MIKITKAEVKRLTPFKDLLCGSAFIAQGVSTHLGYKVSNCEGPNALMFFPNRHYPSSMHIKLDDFVIFVSSEDIDIDIKVKKYGKQENYYV